MLGGNSYIYIYIYRYLYMSHLLLTHFILQYLFSRVPAVHTSCQFSFSTLLIRCSVTSQRESKLCTQGVFATDGEGARWLRSKRPRNGNAITPGLTRGDQNLHQANASATSGRLELFEVVRRVHRPQPTAAADRHDIDISDITGFKRPHCQWIKC